MDHRNITGPEARLIASVLRGLADGLTDAMAENTAHPCRKMATPIDEPMAPITDMEIEAAIESFTECAGSVPEAHRRFSARDMDFGVFVASADVERVFLELDRELPLFSRGHELLVALRRLTACMREASIGMAFQRGYSCGISSPPEPM